MPRRRGPGRGGTHAPPWPDRTDGRRDAHRGGEAQPVARRPRRRLATAPDMRQAIARLMSRSSREIPHYYLATTVDLAAADAGCASATGTSPSADRLVPAALLLKAIALAARRHPGAQRVLAGRRVPSRGQRPPRGRGVPARRRAGRPGAARRPGPAARRPHGPAQGPGRAGPAPARLRGSELSDPTITVTNLGDQGVESVHGVIYPPQVALVGPAGSPTSPWAVDGLLGMRPCRDASPWPRTTGPRTAPPAAASSPRRPAAPEPGGTVT